MVQVIHNGVTVGALSVARQGYVDNINQAGLLQITTARAGYLDHIDLSLKELWYEAYAYTIDDHPSITVGGTSTNPERFFDNDISAPFTQFLVNQTVTITFPNPVYVKRVRFHWDTGSDSGNRYRIQAFVNGVWIDVLTDIVDGDVSDWGSWLNLTTPTIATEWRIECTLKSANVRVREMEMEGVGLSG